MSIKVIHSRNVEEQVKKELLEAFIELGHMAAIKAYQGARHGKKYQDRTSNLRASYGSAVYINGELIEESIRQIHSSTYKVDKRAPSGYETGERALQTYFRTAFVVRKRDTWTILVAASMWYASMVEKKGFDVIEIDEARKYIAANFDDVVGPILKKHGLESFLPTLRKGIGTDNEYFRFGGSRHK